MAEPAGRWLRVSTKGQDEANQIPDIDRWIADHDYELRETYQLHGKSASKGKQDAELNRVIADMQAGRITVLVVWQSSRIERRGAYSVFDLARRVREAGGRIEYVQDAALNQTNDLSDVLLALYATKDRQKSQDISKQVLASFGTIKANNGAIGRAIYGYRVTGETKYGKTFTPYEPEAEVIREAARRYLEGATIDALCDDFNARGIPSPVWKGKPGKHWYAKTLAGLLRSPSIAGRRVDANGKTVATFEPLISWQDHKSLVARLDSRAHRKGISPGNVALLTSTLFDASGHPMYRLGPAYYCRKCHARVRVEKADATVNAKYLADTDIAQAQILIPGENHKDEIERLRQDRSELDDLAPDYDERHAALTAEIRRLAALPAEPDHVELIDTPWTEGELWAEMNDAQRRDWLMARDVRWTLTSDGQMRQDA